MSVGLGIRPEIIEHVIDEKPRLGFLEAHSENYFGESIARAKLLELREHYDISLHGVGLSLGRADDLDENHLLELKDLVAAVNPRYVSEHLAWSAYSHRHLPDLLPLPLVGESLNTMCEHVDRMQDALGRQVLVENPSNYLLFEQIQIPEPEFLNSLAERTGCGLLIDVNNVYVSSTNLSRDPSTYLLALNSNVIKQYHLAGFTPVERDDEIVLVDTHNHTVYPEVWQLFEHALATHGVRDTLIEWDSDFPNFDVLEAECRKAEAYINVAPESHSIAKDNPGPNNSQLKLSESKGLEKYQNEFLNQIIHTAPVSEFAIDDHMSRVWVYQNNTRGALLEYLQEVYPAVQGVVGEDYFKLMVDSFVSLRPPEYGNIYRYGQQFDLVAEHLEGLSEVSYLGDLVALEWALHVSYFASLGEAIPVAELSQEELLGLAVKLNDSVHIIESDYPLDAIHRQSLPDYEEQVSIDLAQSKDVILVYKQGYRVSSRLINSNELLFLRAIQESENLMQAIEGCSGSIGAEPVSQALSLVFGLELLNKK